MLKMVVLSLVLTSIYFAGCEYGNQKKKPNVAQKIEHYISLLAEETVEYYDDGAADATVVPFEYDSQSGNTTIKPGTVSKIIEMGDKSIPVLIKHLDDTRPSKATFNGKKVPIGYLCLDILAICMVDRSCVMFVRDCADDGLGNYLYDEYYFRPDVCGNDIGKEKTPPKAVIIVKSNWEKAYLEGKVKPENSEP